ncbi:hypothetical protein [Xanthomonas sp. NCPPB 2632]
MKKRFSEEQIIGFLREAETGPNEGDSEGSELQKEPLLSKSR